jgi:hypothetical protein
MRLGVLTVGGDRWVPLHDGTGVAVPISAKNPGIFFED